MIRDANTFVSLIILVFMAAPAMADMDPTIRNWIAFAVMVFVSAIIVICCILMMIICFEAARYSIVDGKNENAEYQTVPSEQTP